MWNPLVILVLCLCGLTYAVPLGLKKNMPIVQKEDPMLVMAADEETRPEVMMSRLNLPSNATSIRADITDGFSCDDKAYGYYADVENECQIFHVCLPVTYADGKENTFRWSFICPEETVFSQDSFTCMRPADMSIGCEESFKYYELNKNFGMVDSEDSPSAEEEMNTEEMSRLPSIENVEQENKQTVQVAPVKKQNVKTPSSNRRKPQTNRVTVESIRRKTQPLRKIPQPLAPVVPAPEQSIPVQEPEVEKTTVKYTRLTKRPIAPTKEQAKPEAPKPEQQIVRQELFTQKRKRPQVFTATRLDAAVQTETDSKPEETLKTDVDAKPQSVSIAQDQAEAQASEIAEVSVKPQVEKTAEQKPMAVEKAPSAPQLDAAPMPASDPITVEVAELPAQRLEKPSTPLVEDPKPAAVESMKTEELTKTEESTKADEPMKAEEPTKAEEEKLLDEELIAEQAMQAELTKILEAMQKEEMEKIAIEKPVAPAESAEAEKVLFEPLEEAGKLPETNEPEKLIEALKTAEVVPQPEMEIPEPVKSLETAMMPEAPLPEAQNVLAEAPLAETKPEVAQLEPEKPKEDETPLHSEVSENKPLPEAEDAPKATVEVEAPTSSDTDVLLKAESPIAEPEKLLDVEAPVAIPQMQEPEVPAAEPEMPQQSETELDLATAPKAETVVTDEEKTKTNAVDLSEKPAASDDSVKNQAEAEALQFVEPMPAQPPAGVEEIASSPVAEAVDTQSLILDFITSLVNSENSNLEEKLAAASEPDQVPSESEPEATISQLTEERPKPMYITMMHNNDEMYQIPVQVIETPQPEVLMPAQAKLPLEVNENVELVKDSLDKPAEKQNLVQQTSADQPQPDSEEVKPIYHRYIELGSNLLKSETLTASDEEEPTVVSAADSDSLAQENKPQSPAKLNAEPASEIVADSAPIPADLPASRNMNRFRMDPRKRRFFFRSDAS